MKCLQCKEKIEGGYYKITNEPKITFGRFIDGEVVLFKNGDTLCEKCWLFPGRREDETLDYSK